MTDMDVSCVISHTVVPRRENFLQAEPSPFQIEENTKDQHHPNHHNNGYEKRMEKIPVVSE